MVKYEELEVHICPEDVGTTDHYLMWTKKQQARTKRNRRGRILYKWRLDELDIEEKQEFKEKMTRNAVKFSELVKSVGRREYCRRMGTVGQDHSKKSYRKETNRM